MGHENPELNQEVPAENGNNNGGEIDVIEKGDVEGEETVVLEIPRTPGEEEAVEDPELFKGVPEGEILKGDEE